VIPVRLAAACWQKLSKSPVGRDSVEPGRMSSGDARLPRRAVIGEKTFNENERMEMLHWHAMRAGIFYLPEATDRRQALTISNF